MSNFTPDNHIHTPSEVKALENPAYLREQLITYIGNKRTLLNSIETAIQDVQRRLGKDKLRMLDGFAGSGVVSRLMKRHAEMLICNDLEDYARIIGECYLANRSDVRIDEVTSLVDKLNAEVDQAPVANGFIRRLYSPLDEKLIEKDDRVFYTNANAQRLDTYRTMIENVPESLRSFLMGPLLSSASIHANTAGVFKGFYKDRETGKGKFGGSGADALSRILAPIELRTPVLSNYECPHEVLQVDAKDLSSKVEGCDLAYFDPPYNQHPYGSNYFMLNLLATYEEPQEISQVSGIPTNWKRSDYNVRTRARQQLFTLLKEIDSRFVLLSYNSEGFIPPSDMREFLGELGQVDEVQLNYNAFRGSRNLRDRPIHVTEHLYLVDKSA